MLAAAGPNAAQRPGPTVTHVARAVAPGEVVLLTVTFDAPLSQVRATAFGSSIPLFEAGGPGMWQGVVGIDLATKPGKHGVVVGGRAGTTAFTCTHTLAVTPRRFRTRRLTVPKEYVTPPESELPRIERETRRLVAALSTMTPERLWAAPFLPPVPGPMISPFGTLSVLNGTPRSRHSGVDFRAAEGTPVLAPAAGRVVLTGDLYFSGRTVVIDHGLGVVSMLGHLSEARVREGDTVARGDEVGAAGSTGRVTGPHLHWTVRVAGSRVDPLSLLAVLGPDGKRLP